MPSWEDLDMIQSSHKIHLEIKISWIRIYKVPKWILKAMYKMFTSSILQKRWEPDAMDMSELKGREKDLEILANLEFVKQEWPAAEL